MISTLRTALTLIVATTVTIVAVLFLLLAVLLRIRYGPASVYERIPKFWSRAILWASGADLHVHGLERVQHGGPYIFISNHISLFDIPCLVTTLPHHYFVAKAELFRVPIFGTGMRATGTIPIQRDNQKAALGAYDIAVERIRGGASVVVFPEGTRGTSYPIRPFKKGPFVFAVKAGVPVVPCIVHGTIEVLPKGTIRVHPGRVDVHVLEPIPTSGYGYEDRDALAQKVHDSMAHAMNTLYLNQ